MHVESAATVLRDLKSMGVLLAIDDFGTGYSSLSYLRQFPIDTLKIDQSFVRDVTTDPVDAAIVSAVIGLARTLGQRVVAEGVESREQVAFLKTRLCDEGQGYYFARPVIAEEFTGIASRAAPVASPPRPRRASTPDARPGVLPPAQGRLTEARNDASAAATPARLSPRATPPCQFRCSCASL